MLLLQRFAAVWTKPVFALQPKSAGAALLERFRCVFTRAAEFRRCAFTSIAQYKGLPFFNPQDRNKKQAQVMVDASEITLMQTTGRTTAWICVKCFNFRRYAGYNKHHSGNAFPERIERIAICVVTTLWIVMFVPFIVMMSPRYSFIGYHKREVDKR